MKTKRFLAALAVLCMIPFSAATVHAAGADMAEAYKEVLADSSEYARYSLYDLTGDGEPELIICQGTGSMYGSFEVYAYRNGVVVDAFGSRQYSYFEAKSLAYYPERHILLSAGGSVAFADLSFFEVNGSSAVLKERLFLDDYGETTVYQSVIGGESVDITKEEYTEHIRVYVPDYSADSGFSVSGRVPLGNQYENTDFAPLEALLSAESASTEAADTTDAPASSAAPVTTAADSPVENAGTGDSAVIAVAAAGAALLCAVLVKKKER